MAGFLIFGLLDAACLKLGLLKLEGFAADLEASAASDSRKSLLETHAIEKSSLDE